MEDKTPVSNVQLQGPDWDIRFLRLGSAGTDSSEGSQTWGRLLWFLGTNSQRGLCIISFEHMVSVRVG